MATKKSTKQTELTFEDSIKRLDEIASKLENGDATLENSLTLFEEGIGLVKYCNDILNNAQQKIKVLTANDGK